MLSRFILYKDHYRPSDNSVRPAAFLPNSRGETSVFRVSNISTEETWRIGNEVATSRNRTLYGKADLLTPAVLAQNLRVESQEPPPRHANIIGWPSGKDERKMIAIELAAEASFHLFPSTSHSV